MEKKNERHIVEQKQYAVAVEIIMVVTGVKETDCTNIEKENWLWKRG